MKITFEIIHYFDYSNLQTYLDKKVQEIEPLKSLQATNKLYLNLFFGGGMILSLFLLLAKAWELSILLSLGVMWGGMWGIPRFLAPKKSRKPQIRFKHSGEKIHFTKKGIRLEFPSKTRNVYFLYEEISNFCLVYYGFLTDEDVETTFFSWKKGEKAYKYEIRISNSNQKESLINLLKYLHENKYSFTELDPKGIFLHLLNVSEVEKQEEMPLQPQTNIEAKYQKLIDQIGRKDEEE